MCEEEIGITKSALVQIDKALASFIQFPFSNPSSFVRPTRNFWVGGAHEGDVAALQNMQLRIRNMSVPGVMGSHVFAPNGWVGQ